jgi:hypothetical protein
VLGASGDGDFYGGEGGIRTHGTVSRSQHFQCCQFNHSCTSPEISHKKAQKAQKELQVIQKGARLLYNPLALLFELFVPFCG